MARNLYLILVVLFRTTGAYAIAAALVPMIVSLVAAPGGGGAVKILAFLPGALGGLLLWFAAKPVARLITRDLEP